VTVIYTNYYDSTLSTNISFNVSIVCTPIITYTYTGITEFTYIIGSGS